MNRAKWCLLAGSLAVMTMAEAADNAKTAPPMGELTAEQIVERNVAARGGLAAWRKIQTMAWTGRIESGPNGATRTPFMMTFRRPEATRFEIMTDGQRAVRVFDGASGWKLRPNVGSPPEVTDYSAEEISFARDSGGLDGPLVDYMAKGVGIALVGMDTVKGHRAYHLKVTLPSGQGHNDWIDTGNFLELKYDRATRNAVGMPGIVSVYFRNYQTLNGLTLPFLIETGVGTHQATDRMIIEKIAFNPEVDGAMFTKPAAAGARHRGVVVDTRPKQPPM